MTGNVWQLLVATGDVVAAGAPLLILESMKMEFPIEAPVDGRCTLLVAEGDNVTRGQVLCELVDEGPDGH